MSGPVPSRILLKDKGHKLELQYADGGSFTLTAEYLRVESPSAEVQGHGGQGGVLPVGKEQVSIARIERMGHYALRLIFDDGHNSGIYTWACLRELAEERDGRWQSYLGKLRAQGRSRDPGVQIVRLIDPKNQ